MTISDRGSGIEEGGWRDPPSSWTRDADLVDVVSQAEEAGAGDEVAGNDSEIDRLGLHEEGADEFRNPPVHAEHRREDVGKERDVPNARPPEVGAEHRRNDRHGNQRV